MFPLHESTQRKLCRIVFVAVCIAPTVLLAGYGLSLRLPAHRAAAESALADATGLRAQIDRVVHPRPGQTRLFDVRLRDAESGQEVGQIRELEISSVDGRTLLFAAQPKLDARYFELVFEQFEQRVLRSGKSPATDLQLHAADLTIISRDAESQTLRDVVLRVTHENDSTIADLHYLVAGVEMSHPASVRITRTVSGDSIAATKLAWNTRGAALPVAPWAARFPWLSKLGDRCQFRGEFTGEQQGADWRGDLGGELSRIDLDVLVSGQFPHKLSGQGRAILESLRFEHGRVASARGRIEAGPGVIGQPLLKAAAEQFGLQVAGEASPEPKPDALRRYQKLALHFALDDNQLALRGECGETPDGTAITLGGQRYSTTPENSLSPLALVRTLSPASEHQVPATQATRQLVQVLPLPSDVLQAEEVARGHLRGAKK